MSIEKLPQELLSHVLGFVPTLKDLAQCRLVCTGWNQPAEKAMFAGPIILNTFSKAKALLKRLKQNPEMGKRIRSLELGSIKRKHLQVYLDLLPLVFTPAMETLSGDISASVFYRRLVSIAKASETSFSKLSKIPMQRPHGSKDYYKAIYYFRKTLQELFIGWDDPSRIPMHAFDRLDQVDHLTTLTIDGEINSVPMLDSLLSKCTRVKTLNVMPWSMQKQVMSESRLTHWMETHVVKVPSVTKIVMEKTRQPDILEYLLYKYPNVKEATVYLNDTEMYEERMCLFNGVPMMLTKDNCNTTGLERMIVAMQYLPCYRIVYLEDLYETVLEAIDLYLEDYGQGEVTYGDGPSSGWIELKVDNGDCTGCPRMRRYEAV